MHEYRVPIQGVQMTIQLDDATAARLKLTDADRVKPEQPNKAAAPANKAVRPAVKTAAK